jgi:hypothetical protein
VALEKIETGLKAALMRDGTRLLADLLNELKLETDVSRHGEQCYGKQTRMVETVLGPIKLDRNYYYDRQMQRGRIPLDEALGLMDGYSPGLARLMCWAGSQSAGYPAASQALQRYGGLKVDPRQIQRMVGKLGPSLAEVLDRPWESELSAAAPTMYISIDATGVPMMSRQLEGRKGKQPDGTAKTREVKFGCIFTQHHVDEKGRPWRDLDSTTYVGGFETAGDFGHRIHREAERRKVFQAQKQVLIADGAPWIWELARTYFPQAIQILDFYHASEHLKLLAEALEPTDAQAVQATFEHWQQCLRQDQLDQVIAEAIVQIPRQGPRRKIAERQLAYLENNRHRMQYGTFQKRGWFIGSGVIEAGCKTVIGQRLKQSGMFWSIEGAQNILTFRCAAFSRRFDQAWDKLHSHLALPA